MKEGEGIARERERREDGEGIARGRGGGEETGDSEVESKLHTPVLL